MFPRGGLPSAWAAFMRTDSGWLHGATNMGHTTTIRFARPSIAAGLMGITLRMGIGIVMTMGTVTITATNTNIRAPIFRSVSTIAASNPLSG